MNNLSMKLLRVPTEEDWLLVKQCALVTVGLSAVTKPDDNWKRKILRSQHSPIRELRYIVQFENIPYWVACELRTHYVGANCYIRSQRNDRQEDYDRNAARQDAPVRMIWSLNAQALMDIAHKRLCVCATKEARAAVKLLCETIEGLFPEFDGLLVPMCVYQGGHCPEFNSCGRWD